MKRNSWARHLKTDSHKHSIQTLEDRRRKEEDQQKNYERPYDALPVEIRGPLLPETARHRPEMTLDAAETGLPHTYHSDSFRFTDKEIDAYFPSCNPNEIKEHNERVLREEMELLRLHSMEADLEGHAEDATVPDFISHLRENGK